MNILKKMQRVPGGMMLIPMGISAVFHTINPEIFNIGNPTEAIFTNASTMSIVGFLLFFCGIQSTPSLIMKCMKRSGVLITVKLIWNIVLSLIFIRVGGMNGLFGITSMTFVAALSSCNPGLYISLMKSFGDATDEAGFALLNIVSLPFISICILGYANGSGIEWKAILSTLLPFLLGMLVGNTDTNFKNYFREGTNVLIPFLGIAFGWNIDLRSLAGALVPGLICCLLVTALNFIPLILIDRKLLKQRGHCAAAICCVAGLAITVPQQYAAISAEASVLVEASIAQLSAAVIFSAILTPIITSTVARSVKYIKT